MDKFFTAIVLAAGKGTRMGSFLPKVLHKVAGRAMIEYILDSAIFAGANRTIIVVGYGSKYIYNHKKIIEKVECVLQKEQKGTGHAVMSVEDKINDDDTTIMVLCGDMPLLKTETLLSLYKQHTKSKAAVTLVTTRSMPDIGYGRVIRYNGKVSRIVEKNDCSNKEIKISEYNCGIYCFEKEKLFFNLKKIRPCNVQKEYYLTDIIDILKKSNEKIETFRINDWNEVRGVNSRIDLADVDKIMRKKITENHMNSGIMIIDPQTTYIDFDVQIGVDSIIYPNTILEGKTIIGKNCKIGPNTMISDTIIGNETIVNMSYAKECVIGNKITIGPFSHLRPNTIVKDEARLGNFVEIKNSTIGKKSKVSHLSYIGDTEIKNGVNVGCGVVTVNYNGTNKNKTLIEQDSFIGCNTNLIAPVTIGNNAFIAAGSTISEDVPPYALGISRCYQKNKLDWTKKRDKKSKNK